MEVPLVTDFESPDEAELAYYKAFRNLNLDAMRQIWMEDHEVYCIHPGGGVQSGYQQVVGSWARIFDGAQAPEVKISILSRMKGDGIAVHLVEEQIGQGESAAVVLATNVYRKVKHRWYMVSHHGGLSPRQVNGQLQEPSIH
jgi:ketosteroid isomerase-like protein